MEERRGRGPSYNPPLLHGFATPCDPVGKKEESLCQFSSLYRHSKSFLTGSRLWLEVQRRARATTATATTAPPPQQRQAQVRSQGHHELRRRLLSTAAQGRRGGRRRPILRRIPTSTVKKIPHQNIKSNYNYFNLCQVPLRRHQQQPRRVCKLKWRHSLLICRLVLSKSIYRGGGVMSPCQGSPPHRRSSIS